MHLEDMVLVSVDDHVVEPPDLFEGRLPQKYADVAPKLVRKESGIDVWQFMGAELPNIGLNAVAGRPPEEYAMDPQSFDDMRSYAKLREVGRKCPSQIVQRPIRNAARLVQLALSFGEAVKRVVMSRRR